MSVVICVCLCWVVLTLHPSLPLTWGFPPHPSYWHFVVSLAGAQNVAPPSITPAIVALHLCVSVPSCRCRC